MARGICWSAVDVQRSIIMPEMLPLLSIPICMMVGDPETDFGLESFWYFFFCTILIFCLARASEICESALNVDQVACKTVDVLTFRDNLVLSKEYLLINSCTTSC